MEHEFGLPSPVDRKDLPRKGRRWPKVVAGVFVVVVLLLVFLPQLLSIGPGKALAVAYLERQTRMKVTVQRIKTSWTGGTTIYGVWFSDVKGARMGAAYIQCDASLWQLVRGNYSLGNADAHNVLFDYVCDYGDGRDVFDAMKPPPPPLTPDGPPTAPPPPPKEEKRPWALFGHIKINNSTFRITRGQVTDQKGYPTVYHVLRFNNVNGTIDMPGPGQAWSVDLKADMPAVVPDEPSGTARLTGQVQLGAYGSFADAASSGELKLELRRMPVSNGISDRNQRMSGLCVIDPNIWADDWERLLGPVLQSVEIVAKVEQGTMRLTTLKVMGSEFEGKTPRIEGPMVIDWSSAPADISEGAAPLRFSVRTTRRLGQVYLGSINPFLYDASSGWTELTLKKFRLPLGKTNEKPEVTGTLVLTDTKLAVDGDWWKGFDPVSATGQWQRIVGRGERMVAMSSPAIEFVSKRQWCTPKDQSFTLDGLPVLLKGCLAPPAKLKFEAALGLGPEGSSVPEANGVLRLPLGGTLDKPELQIDKAALSRASQKPLTEMLDEHQRQQNGRAVERLRDQGPADDDPLQRIRAAVGLQPATRPGDE